MYLWSCFQSESNFQSETDCFQSESFWTVFNPNQFSIRNRLFSVRKLLSCFQSVKKLFQSESKKIFLGVFWSNYSICEFFFWTNQRGLNCIPSGLTYVQSYRYGWCRKPWMLFSVRNLWYCFQSETFEMFFGAKTAHKAGVSKVLNNI